MLSLMKRLSGTKISTRLTAGFSILLALLVLLHSVLGAPSRFTRRDQRKQRAGRRICTCISNGRGSAVAPPAPIKADEIPPAQTHTATPAVSKQLFNNAGETAGIDTRHIFPLTYVLQIFLHQTYRTSIGQLEKLYDIRGDSVVNDVWVRAEGEK